MYNGRTPSNRKDLLSRQSSVSSGPTPMKTPPEGYPGDQPGAYRAKDWGKGFPFYKGRDLRDYIVTGGLVKLLPSKARKEKKLFFNPYPPQSGFPKKVPVKAMKVRWLLNAKNFPANALLVAPHARNPHPLNKYHDKNSIANVGGNIAGLQLPLWAGNDGTIASNANVRDGFYKKGTKLKIVTINETMQTITETTLKLVSLRSVTTITAEAKLAFEIQKAIMTQTMNLAEYIDPVSFLDSEYTPSKLFKKVGKIIQWGQNLDKAIGIWVIVNQVTVPFKPLQNTKRSNGRKLDKRKIVSDALKATEPKNLPLDGDIQTQDEPNKPIPGFLLGSIAAGIAGLLLL